MSFLAWVKKAILNALGVDIPWGKVGTALIVVLTLVAYTDRSAFLAGVEDWTADTACQADHKMVSVLSGDPQMPKMKVVANHGVCTVVSQGTPATGTVGP